QRGACPVVSSKAQLVAEPGSYAGDHAHRLVVDPSNPFPGLRYELNQALEYALYRTGHSVEDAEHALGHLGSDAGPHPKPLKQAVQHVHDVIAHRAEYTPDSIGSRRQCLFGSLKVAREQLENATHNVVHGLRYLADGRILLADLADQRVIAFHEVDDVVVQQREA